MEQETKQNEQYSKFLRWYNECHKDVEFWEAEPKPLNQKK